MISLGWKGRGAAEAELQKILRNPAENRITAALGNLSTTSHRMIQSDNLPVLLAMSQAEHEAFDLIYIDPPYNTGNRKSSLSFHDCFGSSDEWLSFMYPRLKLSHSLLGPEGLFFMSIDDRELSHVTVLLREIFGQDNHLATLKWKKKRKPSFLHSHISSVIEYILVFARNAQTLGKLRGGSCSEATRPVLNAGNTWVERIIRAGTPAFCKNRSMSPGLHTTRTLSFQLLDELTIAEGHVQQNCRVQGPFRVGQELLDQTLFITRTGGLRRKVLPTENSLRHATDDATHWPTNEDAQLELRKLMGASAFTYPKPTAMLRKLIQMHPHRDRPLNCLDFFAGSGSFAEAVMRQGIEDSQMHRVTLVQSAEPMPQSPQAQNLGPAKTIFEVMLQRVTCVTDALSESTERILPVEAVTL